MSAGVAGEERDFASGERTEYVGVRRFAEGSGLADLTGVGLTKARAATLNALAAACAARPALLQSAGTLEDTLADLCALPGIGPWTAQYIAMRALREPDAFPASDLGLLRAMETKAGRPTPAALAERAEAWRPWRAYAALRLWTTSAPV